VSSAVRLWRAAQRQWEVSVKSHALWFMCLFFALASTAWAASETANSCAKELSLSQVVAIVDRELAHRFGSAERPLPREIEIRRVGCEYVYTEWQDLDVVGAWFGVTIAYNGQVAHFEYGH
jgi:hypothetical protein